MKNEVNPAMLIVAGVIILALLGGLYYVVLGPGSPGRRKAPAASPYGLVPGQPLKTPPSVGSGRNSITGEPLNDTHMKYPVGGFPGPPPSGAKAAPGGSPGGH